MQRTREYRRHQFWRAIARARRFLKIYDWDDNERRIHLFARTRRPCSCHMCRNEKYKEHKREYNKNMLNEAVEDFEKLKGV